MSRLHTYVDVIVFPFGNAILIKNLDDCLLTTGAPSIRKFPTSPNSEKANFRFHFIFGVLILVVAIGRSCVLLACNIDLPVVFCVFLRSGSGLPNSTILVISGTHLFV